MHGKHDLNRNLRNAVKLLPQESDPVYTRLIRLAEAHGIKVFIAQIKEAKGVCFAVKGKSTILIDDSLTGDKRCLVMAHELGHAVLHTNTSSYLYFKDKKYREEMEEEADRFAGKLLSLLERKKVNGKLKREEWARDWPEFDPEPPAATAKGVREYIVTAAVSKMAA